jgi:hypothetical protein
MVYRAEMGFVVRNRCRDFGSETIVQMGMTLLKIQKIWGTREKEAEKVEEGVGT